MELPSREFGFDIGFTFVAAFEAAPDVLRWFRSETATTMPSIVQLAADAGAWAHAPIQLTRLSVGAKFKLRSGKPTPMDRVRWDAVETAFAEYRLVHVVAAPTITVPPQTGGPPFTEYPRGPIGIAVGRLDWSRMQRAEYFGEDHSSDTEDGYWVDFSLRSSEFHESPQRLLSKLRPSFDRAIAAIRDVSVIVPPRIEEPSPHPQGGWIEAQSVRERLEKVFGKRLITCEPRGDRLIVQLLRPTPDELDLAEALAQIPVERLDLRAISHDLNQRAEIAQQLRRYLHDHASELTDLDAHVTSIADGEIVVTVRNLDDDSLAAIRELVPSSLLRIEHEHD